MRSCLFALLACLTAACAGEGSTESTDDPTLYLTGTEERARQHEDGSYDCESPRKVLICHIPPGNPDNAHTICVGAPAAEAHERNHGDPIDGPCEDGSDDDDGTTDDVGDDGTTDDVGDDGADDVGDDGDGSDDGSDDTGDDTGDGEPGPDGGVDVD